MGELQGTKTSVLNDHHNLLLATIGEYYSKTFHPTIIFVISILKKKKISDTQHFFFACSEKIARESKIHSYKKSLNGFVARLLPHEAQRISGLHKYKIDTQISTLKRLMTLLITSDVIMLALTCRWKESRISFSKHIAPSSHNENMGFLRNARNIETKKRQYGEQYHCWHLGYRLVKIFFFFLSLISWNKILSISYLKFYTIYYWIQL